MPWYFTLGVSAWFVVEDLHFSPIVFQIDMPRHSPRNTETLAADPRVIPTGNTLAEEVAVHHNPELERGFKALRDKGLKVTNCHEDIP